MNERVPKDEAVADPQEKSARTAAYTLVYHRGGKVIFSCFKYKGQYLYEARKALSELQWRAVEMQRLSFKYARLHHAYLRWTRCKAGQWCFKQ